MSRTNALPVAAVIRAGCNGRELPTLPASVNPTVPITLTISHVGPKEGWPFYYTEVFGTGFNPGVRLTFGGVDAPVWPRNGILVTNPPWREPGRGTVRIRHHDIHRIQVQNGSSSYPSAEDCPDS